MHSTSPPSAKIEIPIVGISGIRATAPCKDATFSARSRTISIPKPIGTRPRPRPRLSKPNDIMTRLTRANGMIHIAITGTAIALASSPYNAIPLK
jgi:hypothetical protein